MGEGGKGQSAKLWSVCVCSGLPMVHKSSLKGVTLSTNSLRNYASLSVLYSVCSVWCSVVVACIRELLTDNHRLLDETTVHIFLC